MIRIIAFLSGFLSSLGVGGGLVLITFLTVFMEYDQITAGIINLIFFIPIAFVSVVIHKKNGLISFKKLLPGIISGALFSWVGVNLALFIGSDFLGKIYSVFLIIFGILTFFKKNN